MLIIDAHVHIYKCYSLERLFDCAYSNFLKQAKKLNKEKFFQGVLLLAEKTEQHHFNDLLSNIGKQNEQGELGKWNVRQTTDPFCLVLSTTDDRKLYLIQGRQLISKEGLEVLSLATEKELEEGLPLAGQVEESISKQALTVIPWSFGKWMGKRGRVLRSFLDSNQHHPVFLGDNGGRPGCICSSILKRYSAGSATSLISGSDPLPLKSEERRAGSFGVFIDEVLHEPEIGREVKKILQYRSRDFSPYGNPLSFLKFIRLQYLLRLKHRPI